MSLIELRFLVFGIVISVLVGRCFYGKIGWWEILAAPIAGFGPIYGMIILLGHIFAPRARRETEQRKDPSDASKPGEKAENLLTAVNFTSGFNKSFIPS